MSKLYAIISVPLLSLSNPSLERKNIQYLTLTNTENKIISNHKYEQE